MQRYNNANKTCGTCAFWGGERQVERMGQGVLIPQSNAKEKCMVPKGGWKGRDKTCGTLCNDWQKWSVLK